MFKIQFKKCHVLFAVRALERVISKRKENHLPPSVKTAEKVVFGRMDGSTVGRGVIRPVPCIKSIVACHLKIRFRDMLDQELYEVDGRDGLLDKNIVLMSVVVESDMIPVIGVDTGKCNNRATQVAADIVDDGTRIGKGGLCIDIKAIFIFTVNKGFGLFEGRANPLFHFMEKDSLESLAQVSIIEMLYRAPEAFVRKATLCDEAVNMWIPFQWSSKGMEDTKKARYKVLGLVDLIEHV